MFGRQVVTFKTRSIGRQVITCYAPESDVSSLPVSRKLGLIFENPIASAAMEFGLARIASFDVLQEVALKEDLV